MDNPNECCFCASTNKKLVIGPLNSISGNIFSVRICEGCVWDAVDQFRNINGIKHISSALGVCSDELENIHKKADIFHIAAKNPHKEIVPISYWEYGTLKKYIISLENELRKLKVQNSENSVDFIMDL